MKMKSKHQHNPDSQTKRIGKFNLQNKTVLIPEMNRIAAHLVAATFRSFGSNAMVLETYKGLDLGKKYTSGKECFPCQVTLGDILLFLKTEQEKRGSDFDPENYLYFLPESDGPCRFGMYNTFQRMVLDTFPKLDRVKIVSITAKDGYSLDGVIDKNRMLDFRKASYVAVVVADMMERLLWRIRPYETKEGIADAFIEQSMRQMESLFETRAAANDFGRILDKLEEIVKTGRALIDPAIPRKPLIGIVGEIFLRMHAHSNQGLIRTLEGHGAEVVNSSLAEWVNYVTYGQLRENKINFRLNLQQGNLGGLKNYFHKIFSSGANLFYQEMRQKQFYNRASRLIDLERDHKVSHLEKLLKKEDIFTFDVTTETCVSIAAILQFVKEGYNGVVNVYPFTCMPGMTTSAIVKPVMNRMRVPYLDTPYDGSFQPGRETAIRTFMHQATQHFQRYGRKGCIQQRAA
jgi:predicted nucleotide-binding protein (sugar kinase/HSP70/actin superfamily)